MGVESLPCIKVRPVPHEAILNERGERIRIFRLRGYVFFGSIHRLTDRLEQPLGESPPPSFIVLDCAAVLGFDYSSTRVLCLYLLNACSHGVKLVICTAPSGFRLAMTRDLPTGAEGNLRFESDLDRAVEWCEDASIVAYSSDETNTAESRGALLERVAPELEEYLDRQVVFEELLDRLEPWLERRQYDVGDWLGTPERLRGCEAPSRSTSRPTGIQRRSDPTGLAPQGRKRRGRLHANGAGRSRRSSR